MNTLAGRLRDYQNLADRKVLSARKFDAYVAMADKHKVSSIEVRRKRRHAPLVMVVEDDRFTAHYASTILSTDFDLIVCKDGEEAVQAYIVRAANRCFIEAACAGLFFTDHAQKAHLHGRVLLKKAGECRCHC